MGLTDLADDSRSARQIIVQIVNKSSSRFGHQEFYEILIKDLMALERTIDQVERIPLKWRDYFAVIEPLGLNSDELKLRAAIHNVKKVRIDA